VRRVNNEVYQVHDERGDVPSRLGRLTSGPLEPLCRLMDGRIAGRPGRAVSVSLAIMSQKLNHRRYI